MLSSLLSGLLLGRLWTNPWRPTFSKINCLLQKRLDRLLLEFFFLRLFLGFRSLRHRWLWHLDRLLLGTFYCWHLQILLFQLVAHLTIV